VAQHSSKGPKKVLSLFVHARELRRAVGSVGSTSKQKISNTPTFVAVYFPNFFYLFSFKSTANFSMYK
jgi:hypothetical protein